VSRAIFPRERYQGTTTSDLFAEDETTYFDDVEQFFRLQHEAVAELAAAIPATHLVTPLSISAE
jgi:ParB family chromosome partitioning protein